MKTTKINFADTQQFESIFIDYMQGNQNLCPYYNLFPTIENYQPQIDQRNKNPFPAAHRQLLVQALHQQYKNITNKPELAFDLLLKENTFTLTTGHQLNIFTGPLYFHYKIITVINAAKELRKTYPNYHFIPIFWMASEDHDAAEISYFRLFGKKYTWQSQQTGAVGRFSPHSLINLLKEVPEMEAVFTKAYRESNTLAEATRYIVNELYGNEGLIIVDGDDKSLKTLFKGVIKEELLRQPSYKAIQESSEGLEKQGYKIQVHPREINLFYVEEGIRERIVKNNENNNYQVMNTSMVFSEQEILKEVAENPQRFSPNVVLRPLYQEIILPNLSYTGGPGELAYWLQLKKMFEHFNVPFPILLPRNFALYIDKNLAQQLEKLTILTNDLFLEKNKLEEKFVNNQVKNPVDITDSLKKLAEVYQEIADKLLIVDNSLKEYAGARKNEIDKITAKIEKKIKKTEKQKYATELNQLTNALEKLFPQGGLQERTDNFLTFYLNDKQFIKKIIANFNPFDFTFNVLTETEEQA